MNSKYTLSKHNPVTGKKRYRKILATRGGNHLLVINARKAERCTFFLNVENNSIRKICRNALNIKHLNLI